MILFQCQELRKDLIKNGKNAHLPLKNHSEKFQLQVFPLEYISVYQTETFKILSKVSPKAPKYAYRQSLNSNCWERWGLFKSFLLIFFLFV